MDMNCSISNDSADDFLLQLDETSDKASIPAVVMLVIFAVVGLVGNILVLVVYSKKVRLNPTKVLIMTIASFDLVANVGAIPTAITTIFDTWNFSRPGLCKVTVFLGSFTAVGGAISLLIVAVIRYRKVCRPYGWQMTVKHAIIASLGSVLLAFIFSIPYIIIYGVRTRETPCPNISGYDCFADDDYFNTVWPLLNNVLFILIYLTLSISIIVLYIFIGVTAWKHSKYHGASVEITVKDKNAKSKTRHKSAVAIRIVPPADTPKTQPATQGSATSHLFCCSGHHNFDRSIDDTQSSITIKSHSTTGTDVDGTNSETTNPQSITNTKTESLYHSTLGTSLKEHHNKVNSPDQYINTESKFVETQTQRKLLRPFDETKQAKENLLAGNVSNDGDIQPYPHPQNNTSNTGSNLNISPQSHQDYSSPSEHVKKEKRRMPLGRMTAMLIIISAIYVLGFLPFLILTIYKSKNPVKYANFNLTQQVFFNIFYRLYFLNSVANPIVYSWCDLNFRRKCIQLLTCRSSHYS